ncbi:hypothetical protein [Mycobacterium spongiae]|uniref:Uncharacterized protein n=1 Tax=Mycobacterium spongiae TaxID=886343 RepID=A0A975K0Y3_9MYCO|nr:hypothetical protein [Mycobacterium spongiae]QUR68930.1 hypothetical protein F6B93_19285 [Mycobacterium spongiae]
MVATLSQVRAWSTEHLVDAATYWTTTADQWEDVFLQMRNQSHTVTWQGAGGDALRSRTGADLAVVSAKADQLRQASTIARDGAGMIGAAQRRVIYAVEDAHNAGFAVGEDFSVTDTRTSRSAAQQAARHAQAQTLAADIRQRAAQLIGSEHDVAANITTATAGIAATTFPETPGIDDTIISDDKRDGGVQLVDFTQDDHASPPPPFAPWDTPDGTLPPGTGLSPQLQQMLLGGDPASLTGQGLVDKVQQFVQSLPENDPATSWLRDQVADLQAHVEDIEYARAHCSTSDWLERTTQFAGGVIVTGIGGLTAETGAGVGVAVAAGLGTAVAGAGLLQCLVGSK